VFLAKQRIVNTCPDFGQTPAYVCTRKPASCAVTTCFAKPHCLTKIFLNPFRQPSFCTPILGASTRSHALSSQWKKWKPSGTMECKRKIVLRQVETDLSHPPSGCLAKRRKRGTCVKCASPACLTPADRA
jgi:hypothetical protein